MVRSEPLAPELKAWGIENGTVYQVMPAYDGSYFVMGTYAQGANWGALYGVAILSGVGFTMSLFIDGLAFENMPPDAVFTFDERLGILVGSLLSGIVGYIVLDRTLPKAE